jgi:hypothetical protein
MERVVGKSEWKRAQNLDFLLCIVKHRRGAVQHERNEPVRVFVPTEAIVANSFEAVEEVVAGREREGGQIAMEVAAASAEGSQQLVQTGQHLVPFIAKNLRAGDGCSQCMRVLTRERRETRRGMALALLVLWPPPVMKKALKYLHNVEKSLLLNTNWLLLLLNGLEGGRLLEGGWWVRTKERHASSRGNTLLKRICKFLIII